MLNKLATVQIKTPLDLVQAGESIGNAWFRGHGSDKWTLESTLERDAARFGVPRTDLRNRETVMLNLFQQRAHLYNSQHALPSSVFEWHALIRHYGGPSRLFDVTASYMVAAYFALCETQRNSNAVIWVFRENLIPEPKAPDWEAVFEVNDNKRIFVGKPDRLNNRIHSQDGGFFVPCSVEYLLAEQIALSYETDLNEIVSYRSVSHVKSEINHRIWKFIIPPAVQSELFRFLSRCNVRSYSLFSGLDGLALSLREMMRAYD